MRVLNDYEARLFHPKRNGITLENMDDCYVFDDETGDTFPIYFAVPCNHCDACKGAKINSFVHRCKLESQCYDSLPWFCTLTYDDAHLPSDGVSVREMQLFMKRFRINLKRAGFSYSPRYVIVGEYGRKTHRPHYHAIFWNINSRTDLDYLKVSNILSDSWSNGFIQRRLINLSDDKGFFYTSKYLRKDCFVPQGMNPTFCISSRGKGGIGSRFIDKHSEQIRKSLNVDYKFLNKWTGKVEPLCFCSYVLNRIFPSFCRSVSKDFRDAWIDYCQALASLKNKTFETFQFYETDYKTFYLPFRQKISDFLYCPPVSSELGRNFSKFSCEALFSILSRAKEILQGYPSLDFLGYFKTLQEKREVFCSKLIRGIPLINLSVKSHELRKSFALAAAREIF